MLLLLRMYPPITNIYCFLKTCSYKTVLELFAYKLCVQAELRNTYSSYAFLYIYLVLNDMSVDCKKQIPCPITTLLGCHVSLYSQTGY